MTLTPSFTSWLTWLGESGALLSQTELSSLLIAKTFDSPVPFHLTPDKYRILFVAMFLNMLNVSYLFDPKRTDKFVSLCSLKLHINVSANN